MLKRLTKEDLDLIINFYKNDLFKSYINDDNIRDIYESIENDIIIIANIEKSITSLLTFHIIKNNYYCDALLYLEYNKEEIKNLINYSINELRKDERGIIVYFNNYPYDDNINNVILECGFKCDLVNLVYQEDNKIDLVKPYIAINDKSFDVKDYIFNHNLNDIKSSNLYLNIDSKLPDINSVNLDNVNVAVIRDKDRFVIGTVMFGIISNELHISSFYAEDEETYLDLLTLVKNLTRMNIIIELYPTRSNLIELLLKNNFQIAYKDYLYKLI